MKRLLTLVLCAAMIATMLCIVPTAVSAGDVSVGGVADGYTPEGTAITTAEEFAAMTAGGKYYLANDITITATWNAGAERPAEASDATAFAGTLDGNGKTITTSVALFANITGSTVKNLTVAGDVAAIDADHNSAIGCWTNGEVNFENVCNKANVLGGKAAGAFVGYGKTGTVLNIKNCVNNGAVNTKGAQTGGIIGYGLGIITIEDCTNYGTLTNTNGATGGIAGILGHKDKANLHGSYIRRCVNYGDVTGTTLAAGIVARSGRATTASEHIYAVENCENHGDLYLNIPAPEAAVSAYAGGTVGYAWGGAGCKTVNCINTGSINVNNPENPAAAVSLYVAGNVGYVSGASYEIKNNINAGAINITGPAPTTLVLTSYNKNATATIFTNNYAVACGTIPSGMIGTNTDIDAAAAKVVTAEQLASGEVAFAMNTVAGAEIFFQNLGGLDADAVPTLDNSHKSVVKNEDGTYTNPSVNLNVINPLIEAANALVQTDYTPETWANLITALDAAKTEVARVNPDQTAIDAAAAALDAAIKALVDAIPTTPIIDIGGTTYTTVAAALEALTDGATLKLLADITLDATVFIDKSVTIDGNGKTLTAMGFNAVNVKGDSLNVTIKNVKVETDKVGLTLTSCTSAEVKSKLTIADVTVNSTGGNAMNAEMYWDFDMDRCTLTGSYGLHCTKDNSANVITIDDSSLTGNTKYAAYFRSASTITITNSELTNKHNSTMVAKVSEVLSAVQIKTSTADTPTTLTFNNCNVTSSGGYVIAVNPYNKVYINGGTYQVTPPEGCGARDAVVNVGNANAYCKITDGTFKTSTNCAVRAYGANSVLDIEGGTFIYDNAAGAGSAVRSGTADVAGTINISGGTFITNGTGPVLNFVHADGVINVTGGTFENNGTSIVNILSKMYDGAEDTSKGAAFPDGAKKAEFKDGAYKAIVDEQPGGDVTTVPGGSNETTSPDDGDETTSPDNNNDTTTTEKPEDVTTEKPADTDPPKKKNCGSFALAAQLVTILGAAITVVIVKKKN